MTRGIRLTNKEVDQKLFEMGNIIKRLGNYVNNNIKIDFQCLICNDIALHRPSDIFSGYGCANCSGNKKLTKEVIDQRLVKRNIKMIGNYVNVDTRTYFQCLVCNHTWKTKPYNIFTGSGCSKCKFKSRRLSDFEIDQRLIGRNIKRIGTYVNAKIPIEWECLLCNKKWCAIPDNVLTKDSGCRSCSKGKSEKRISELIEDNIKFDVFDPNKTFNFNNRYYYPDFYLEISSKTIVIEYNGEQHYKPRRFGGISQEKANENFIKQQKRDQELRDYCQLNNIVLLEIPYWWKESEIIENFLNFNKILC